MLASVFGFSETVSENVLGGGNLAQESCLMSVEHLRYEGGRNVCYHCVQGVRRCLQCRKSQM